MVAAVTLSASGVDQTAQLELPLSVGVDRLG
jgi:hypothetical protein